MFKIALMTIMMVTCSTAAMAQENQGKKQRMSREQLAEVQAKYIARELALDDATGQKFQETYISYQKELWALGPRGFRGPRCQEQELSDSETEKALKERFDHSRKILDLRESYYKKYSKFLTQKQILRVYELEQQAMKRIAKKHHGQKGQKGHGQFQKKCKKD